MRIQFLQDYRGKLSGEVYYQAGEEGEFYSAQARQLIERGIAVMLDADNLHAMSINDLGAECKRRGIDVLYLEGTGPNGAIRKADLITALEDAPVEVSSTSVADVDGDVPGWSDEPPAVSEPDDEPDEDKPARGRRGR